MKLKGLVDEDFVNYRKPSMFIGTCYCDWKCCVEQDLDISTCQNSELANSKILDIPDDILFDRYIKNNITSSIVIGGLEPFKQIDEVLNFIDFFRSNGCDDDIVIYTGYYPDEITNQLDELKSYKNIIVKFGRFIPNSQIKLDDVLGITLISDNQYAIKIS